jgi:hypothetical protein
VALAIESSILRREVCGVARQRRKSILCKSILSLPPRHRALTTNIIGRVGRHLQMEIARLRR